MDRTERAPRNQFARLLHAVPERGGSITEDRQRVQLVARGTPPLERADLSPMERDIVMLLQRNGRMPFSQIARTLDAPEKTVRSIVAKLEASKNIHITALTFPDLLGFTGVATCAIHLAPGASAKAVALELASFDFVSYVAVTLGSVDIWADILCKDRKALMAVLDAHVRTMEGVQSLEAFLYLNVTRQSAGGAGLSRPNPPAADLSFDEIDSKIFAQLTLNGRAPYNEIALRLGMSEAAVRQRVKRAMDAGILGINALVDPGSLGGDLLAWVAVRTKGGRPLELASLLAQWPLASYVGVTIGRFDLFVEFVCHDGEELLTQLTAMRQHELVETIEPFIYVDLHMKAITFA